MPLQTTANANNNTNPYPSASLAVRLSLWPCWPTNRLSYTPPPPAPSTSTSINFSSSPISTTSPPSSRELSLSFSQLNNFACVRRCLRLLEISPPAPERPYTYILRLLHLEQKCKEEKHTKLPLFFLLPSLPSLASTCLLRS